MEIALVIVGGLVVLTLVAAVGDYLTKTKVARSSVDPQVVEQLRQRIEVLERQASDHEARVAQLTHDVEFTTRLLEKRP